MISMGVIQVKKPDQDPKNFGESILGKPTVLGELCDFQMQLANFYGTIPSFGTLATFEACRVCWIPPNEADVDAIAETLEYVPNWRTQFTTPTNPASAKKTSPPGFTPSKTNPVLHDINEEDKDEDNGGETAALDESSRVLHVSKIYDRKDDNQLSMRAIATAVCKMTKVMHNPFDDPLDKLQGRILLRFTKEESRSKSWCRMGQLEGKGKWNNYANPKKYLYAIEDLGYGADGWVWLTCTYSGAVCVLKFPLHGDMNSGMENWKRAYPEFNVFREKWCRRDALQMPHFTAVKSPDDRLRVLDFVKKTLETKFASKGLLHEDVAWRNIRLYKDGADDLGRVRKRRDADDNNSWVTNAIAKLQREA